MQILRLFRPARATASNDILEIDGLYVPLHSPNVRLKFGEIRFINLEFESEKPRSCHFSPKCWGPTQNLGIGSQNICLWKKVVRTSSNHMLSLVEIGLRATTREGK